MRNVNKNIKKKFLKYLYINVKVPESEKDVCTP